MNEVVFYLGGVLLLVGLGVYAGGLINPDICGSGHCSSSFLFHVMFGGMGIVGAIIMLVGSLVDGPEEEKNE